MTAPPSAAVSVSEAHEVGLDLVAAMGHLVPQLSSSSPAPSADELAEIIAHPGSFVFVARSDDNDAIVGTLTLIVFRIPTGLRALIEDVVVDGSARGMGAATALTHAALDKARGLGCRTVDLTSRPSREAANALYKKLGFEPRDTNVYRFTFGP